MHSKTDRQHLLGFDTLCVHAGQEADPNTGAVMIPITMATTFAQNAPDDHKGWDYSRAKNPTRDILESALACLEGADFAIAFASGCAAATAVFMTLKAGDHVLVGDDVYGGTFRIFDKVMKPFGIEASFIDMSVPAKIVDAIRPNTKMIWVETPSNPMLKITDIADVARICERAHIPLAVDNTFASPALQNPLKLGATLAVHSSTKYLGGHSDILGGAVMTSDKDLAEKLYFIQKAVGAVPSPFDCYMLLRSIKTLSLRVNRQVESANILARWLSEQKNVIRVYYPGLPSHPHHAIARKQMTGFGGMISFEVKGKLEQAISFLKALHIFTLAESLGGVESLAEHPAMMTHASIPKATRSQLGINDTLIRLSVGVESVLDLQRDLENGLNSI